MPDLVDTVSLFTGLAPSELEKLARIAPSTYRKYSIPKKRGGQRGISHPSKQTKMLQYATLELLLKNLPVHAAAQGFVRGIKSPLRKNALSHSTNPFLLRVDFSDFFPSIRPNDLLGRIPIGKDFSGVKITARDHEFLKRVLFIANHDKSQGLPIGGPTSPCVSNVVMCDLDASLSELAREFEFVYTRYADDLIFSTQNKNSSDRLLIEIGKILMECDSPKVSLNHAKTCFMSRNCRRAVTGLILTPQGEVTIGRKNKRMVRALLCKAKYGKLGEKDAGYLQGYLAFLMDVEPSYFNSLALKYGAELVQGALHRTERNSQEK
jgi:RNA-directed DNA polymerase